LLVLAAMLCACDGSEQPATPGSTAAAEVGAKASGEPAALPDLSLYQLPWEWQDQSGTPLQLSALRGQVTVAAMIFTHCAYACPQLVADLQAVESGLGGQADEIRFLLISMDADRDTPEVLAEWAKNRELNANWQLLHGDADAVREVAAVLGVNYVRTPTGDFSHSNLITVLDADGVSVHQQVGLRAEADPTVAAIRELLAR